MSYTKLFSSIVTSTIWTEDAKTCKVWVTMLAIANKHGEVQASIPGLAQIAGLPLDDTEAAIEKFLSPDKYSRTPDDQGRRIEKIEGGWLLLNHAKYRAMASKDEEKASSAKRQSAFRDRQKRNASVTPSNGSVTVSNDAVTGNRDIAEAEAEADSKAYTETEASQPLKRQRAGELLPMDALKVKINSLRPEWKKMPHLSAMEMHTLQGCAHSLACLAESDWQLIRDFLAYAPRGTEKLYQVRSREKFLQTPVDTLTAATEWQKSQGNSPTKSNGGKW
jgi:hypothetical protein